MEGMRTQREKMDRLRDLAAKAKAGPLADLELAERDLLRKEYIAACKADFAATLANLYVLDAEGREQKLSKKP